MTNDKHYTFKCNWCKKYWFIDQSGNNLSDIIQQHNEFCPASERIIGDTK